MASKKRVARVIIGPLQTRTGMLEKIDKLEGLLTRERKEEIIYEQPVLLVLYYVLYNAMIIYIIYLASAATGRTY